MRYLVIATLMLTTLAALAFDPTENLYFYKSKVVSVYDGDTLRADIDLGLDVWMHNQSVRLYGLDAPEMKGTTKVAGLAARDYLTSLLADRPVVIESVKDDREKYGRLVGKVWVLGNGGWCPANTWCLVNDQMIKSGHAVAKIY